MSRFRAEMSILGSKMSDIGSKCLDLGQNCLNFRRKCLISGRKFQNSGQKLSAKMINFDKKSGISIQKLPKITKNDRFRRKHGHFLLKITLKWWEMNLGSKLPSCIYQILLDQFSTDFDWLDFYSICTRLSFPKINENGRMLVR